MWYNAENVFDPADNPSTNDEEFSPSGNRRWTYKRYRHKLQQIAKVITAAGEWDTPALVGLCEVENDSVMTHLLRQTPLRQQHYRYCMTQGSDPRGIQIALLYQRDKFAYQGHTSYPVHFTQKQEKPTRDILHVWGRVNEKEILDVFLCHFPSRSGGEKETEIYRIEAARLLRHLCDSVHSQRESPYLLLMGDFNDTPANKSIREILHALPFQTDAPAPYAPAPLPGTPSAPPLLLYNLFADPARFPFPGSHKYQGEWAQLDQIIVSSQLINKTGRIQLLPESVRLFTPSFLLIRDKTGRGLRPHRSFYGFQYEKGYSDHLPLLIDLHITYP